MKRILSIVLAALLLCGMFAGCKAKKQANSTTDIEIVYWEAGNGRAYMDAIVKAFNDSQDLYHATLVASAENRPAEIYQAADTNTADLYIVSFNTSNAYKDYLVPLDDLLATKPDGASGLTIAEKLGTFIENNKNDDGHVYAIPSTPGNMTFLLYNTELMVDENGNPYKLPNTTDELVDLALSLYSDGKTPFIHQADYWYYVYEAWIAQYEGEQKFYDIWNGIYTDENGVKYENDVRIVTESQGRLEAYRVMEDLLSPKGYTYTNCNSFNHTTAQTYFLNGYAVMQPNGSWIENEMGGNSENIMPMRTPVISALADKLGIRNDKHLSLIVDYVDGTALSEKDQAVVDGYSEEVIQAVREARAIHYGGHPDHVVIPNYSNCIDGATEFLKFYYSDEGIEIMQTVLKGPANVKYSNEPDIDTSTWSAFMQEVNNIAKTANNLRSYLNKPLFYLSGTDHLKINHPIQAMTYRTDGAIQTADQYWAKEVKAWEDEWPTILNAAGLD